MITFPLPHSMFIKYGERSSSHFWELCSLSVREKFGDGPFADDTSIRGVYLHLIDILSIYFTDIIHGENDYNFARYLFANHEASLEIVSAMRDGQPVNVDESDLALNRRILKLALEQCCDVDYTDARVPSKESVQYYVSKVEDLAYIGYLLYYFTDGISEMHLMPESHVLSFDEPGKLVSKRKDIVEAIFRRVMPEFDREYEHGVYDKTYLQDLKQELQHCFGVNYDAAGGLIFEIKRHHNPNAPDLQSIEAGILVQNLVEGMGVDRQNAECFYGGLTISRHNELPIKTAVYQPHSMNRYLSRPILILSQNGEARALVGVNKWVESIYTMGVNGFQWQTAPIEWAANARFKQFMTAKAAAHDKLLEDPVELVFKNYQIRYGRNIKVFFDAHGKSTRVDVKGIGEMDFVFIDSDYKKVIVADCKYNRSKYEMVGYVRDKNNFVDEYEPKLNAKVNWIKGNLALLTEHFNTLYPKRQINLQNYTVEPLFIINTPTFYMLTGAIKTITAHMMEGYIKRGCELATFSIKMNGIEKSISHPYFSVTDIEQ